MGTKIHKKSVKIQAWNSKCPLLCSQVSQNRPKVPKHAKVKPPIMLNDRFAYQECQGPLPTMPRNCNPEAASTDRGPAAEGVAHKIFPEPVFYVSLPKKCCVAFFEEREKQIGDELQPMSNHARMILVPNSSHPARMVFPCTIRFVESPYFH